MQEASSGSLDKELQFSGPRISWGKAEHSTLTFHSPSPQIMKSEVLRVTHELQSMKDKIKENSEKIKVNKTLPYLVSNVIEVCVYVEGKRGHWGLETACHWGKSG